MKNKIKVGDTITGKYIYTFGGSSWFRLYNVLEVEDSARFGKPNQLLTVKITTSYGTVVDEKTKMWANQLF
jgi:hypothetical protein